VQVFDYGVDGGLTYLVMELVPGQTLGEVARATGPLPFARAARIVVQVLSSLAEAHEGGIVHRDIKPDNVMLVPGEGGADVAKVLDFGLAKLREADVGEVTCQGVILGTPSYMSPEQIRGEAVDPRSDVYSAGALLYRLLVGQVPFRADTALSVLAKHLHEIPVPPAERAPHLGIPPGVSRAVMRALRKDPAHRFQRAEDFRAVLVEELRAAGSQSVDSLLDPGRLLRLAWSGAAPATRDDVDAYERKLRRKRYGAAATVSAAVLGAAVLGAGALVQSEPLHRGVEIEPNNTAAEATPLALGQPMTGTLGKRLDEAHGDRDFYAFDLPGPAGELATLRLRISALRSVALCAMLYRPGFTEAVGQYCVGRPGRDLVIPALALPPGRYLLAVLQDLDPHGGPAPYVQECISDPYTILAESVRPEPDAETEPNDTLAAATRVELGRPVKASIAWARDEDVFCLSAAVRGPIRWRLRTAYREGGALEATPLRAGAEPSAVWIHADDADPRGSGEAVSPWLSDPIPAAGGDRCLRVRLAADPRARERVGGGEAYVVEAERAE
jgi:serine/threonine-protein kinase